MAIYHLSIKTVGRSAGRSATGAAAYRSGEKIADLRSGQVFDYTRKHGIEHREIVLPTSMASQDLGWARNRQSLWNAAEAAEKRKDSRVAREYEVAIPHELNQAQRIHLVREFAAVLANHYRVVVDFAIHTAHREGDPRNRHAHVLTTTRELTPSGLGAKTALELSESVRAKRGLPHSRAEFVEIRERWSALGNEFLRQYGHAARIDHRTLAAQGIDRQPTVHLGASVTALRRRGIETDVERRVAWQEQQAVIEKLVNAKAAGESERKREHDAGLLHRSTNLHAARCQRDINKAMSLAQTTSREAWLKYRKNLESSGATPYSRSAPQHVLCSENSGGEKAKFTAVGMVDLIREGLER